ncbi:hydroxyisourate hydrolase [Rhodobacter veldkampii DSM 11550]|uniref:5-hydroxyisourate hydrolase n=1 Tax=Phaeovulum veldkampii DSM 11550 TaxID=1185920 RepID=A0A2T4JD57_9RHOB|nr:hydroxyisourate hydrolase [Phaeovulum veldkampii]MBK5946161.1 hydroxyisourate hydrolase [Phaeovulum veldkampii DSM 11550]NCU19438.1 hydroxyisourate hydrolase [Candidatus Falkowbacteria bacterium]PTE15829.1 hydroxyisourate hydrolase [Phaeovulum veldkampii DSM 11550]TDQ56552.1 5-hydroxyisourate hydrolase [Phaeovulum veldkampii DSM 11550]
MTGWLTTHVLDTARGRPASGMQIDLFRIDGGRRPLHTMRTNSDGRTASAILPADEFQPGTYELLFHAGAWFDTNGFLPEPHRFLDEIPVRFGISDATAHYHVPLLLSPFGYSTYRGS